MASSTISTDCNVINSVNPVAIDMSQPACNGNYCPQCFLLDTASINQVVQLQITNCQWYQGVDLGTNYVIKYDFFNNGMTYEAHVGDGDKTYKLMYGTTGSSATHCSCYA